MCVVGGRPGDDQRRAGFVDENVIDFIDDGIVMSALHAVRQAVGEVVAQEVKAVFAVHAVGDVSLIGFDALDQAQLILILEGRGFFQVNDEGFLAVLSARGHLQHTHAEPQQVVNGRHPARVAAGQVVVDRHQVHTAPGERVEV